MNQQIRISKDMDFSNLHNLELSGFENIATTADSGYIMLPRSAGCKDYGLCYFNKHTEDFDLTLRLLNMPLFGVKTESRCFLAVASGMPFNFILRIVLKDGRYSLYPSFEIFGEAPYEDPCLEIFELFGDDANYSGMARRYRQYRTDKGELHSLQERAKHNPYLAYAVKAPVIRIRCGWKPAPPQVLHQTLENEPEMHVACDFDRVGDILDELKAQGVDKAEICLVGWNVKGHDGRWPQAFPVCEELGGEVKLRQLIKKAQAMGYQITCHTNSTDQYEIADCYSAENNRIERGGQLPIGGRWSGGQMFELCPKLGYEQAEQVLPQVAELGFRGIHYIDVLGVKNLRRCYHKDHPLSYPESLEYAKKLCALCKEQFGGMSSESAYDFIAPYLDYGFYISYDLGGSVICDQPIPFWQLVYHGAVLSNPFPLTVNCTFKGKENVLKMLEYGGKPTFYYYSAFMGNGANWMGKTDCVCNTQEQLKESVAKIKEACDLYNSLPGIHYANMEKHEQVGESIFETTYSDGTVVQVDYEKMEYHISKDR